jgi:hypothetical protein
LGIERGMTNRGLRATELLAADTSITPDELLGRLCASARQQPPVVLRTLANLRGVQRLVSLNISAGRVSEARARISARELLTDASADVVPIDANTVGSTVIAASPTPDSLVATFESLSGVAALGGVALLGTIALALSPSISARVRWGVFAVWATVLSMFLGIGLHRVGFGVEFGTASRYQYMAAMLLAPVLALAVDRLSTWSVGLQRAARVVLVASVLLNLGTLRVRAAEWAERAADSKRLFELAAGSGLLGEVPATTIIDPFNPDVNAVAVLVLVRDGIITPRPPATPEELAEVRRALGLP